MTLISADYRRVQEDLHRDNPTYGVASVAFAPMVARIVTQNAVDQLLDYGAGKGRLGEALSALLERPVSVARYDPAIPEWAAPPLPSDLVCCIDVLEHVEPECLEDVLGDLARLTRRLGFFTIHTGPARKVLSDGRNAHLIQQPASWWLPRIMAHFELSSFQKHDNGFIVLVEASAHRPAPATPAAAGR